ncbi:hypothetical protein SEA_ELESAR_48 [Arthrobacter phage Elesar]|uniref:Uncharacterized protein n=1 Tax=Arthrobacter phage Elesar TaxID=2510522 RepID=A0A411CQ96_9CAUD|nr:hypothetical protein QEO79_gp48 [Arthrobacter phage Elesar]QAY16099.1 hypothetical protein SEA_ELESAR_48 [Arthrobacter phage Elesar]
MSATAERLDAIEARANAATAGPWEARREDLAMWVFSADEMLEAKLGYVGNAGPLRDAEFIAQAREDIPFLVDLVRDQQAALDAVLGLHTPDDEGDCGYCADYFCDTRKAEYPCATVRTITDALEPKR